MRKHLSLVDDARGRSKRPRWFQAYTRKAPCEGYLQFTLTFASLTAGRSVVPCVGFKTWQQHPRTQYRGWCSGRASVRTSRPNLRALGMSQLPSGLEILHMSQVGVTRPHAAPLLKPLGRLRLLILHEVELDSSDIEPDLRPLCSNDGLTIQLCGLWHYQSADNRRLSAHFDVVRQRQDDERSHVEVFGCFILSEIVQHVISRTEATSHSDAETGGIGSCAVTSV